MDTLNNENFLCRYRYIRSLNFTFNSVRKKERVLTVNCDIVRFYTILFQSKMIVFTKCFQAHRIQFNEIFYYLP